MRREKKLQGVERFLVDQKDLPVAAGAGVRTTGEADTRRSFGNEQTFHWEARPRGSKQCMNVAHGLVSRGVRAVGCGTDVFAIVHSVEVNLFDGAIRPDQGLF